MPNRRRRPVPPARHRPAGGPHLRRLAAGLALLLTATLAPVPAAAAAAPGSRPASALAGPGPLPATEPRGGAASQPQAQVLTWTAGNDYTHYTSAPATAVAGPTTIVFENSAATGNTTGMQHTLTFVTGDPAYNSDANVNILADPYDSSGGRHQVDVVLTPGRYRYFCAIPGHGSMYGILEVTDGGGDTTPPTVSAQVTGERNGDGDYVGAATVTLTASDSGSGVQRIEYSLDGQAYGTYSAPVSVTATGDHTVNYRATDAAGNTSTVGTATFTVVAPSGEDTTPPTVTAQVTGERNGDGDYLGSATVTLTATDSESGVERVEYSLDGAAYAAYTAPVTVTATGAHTVDYRATDAAGNTAPAQAVAFTVVAPSGEDTTPPTVTAQVTGERNGDGEYLGSATVTLTATDDESGVEHVEYSLDGAAYAHYAAPVVVEQAGDHTVSYRATDRAGNTSTVGTATFTVLAGSGGDTTPPTVTAQVTGERDGEDYVGTATVTLTATDTGSGVARVEYSLDGAAYAAYTAPVTVTATGAHTLGYRATDRAGNTSTVGTATFRVVAPPAEDRTPPVVTAQVSGQRNPDGAYQGAATVTLAATDDGSGVDRIEYSLDGAAYAAYTAPVTVNQVGAHAVNYRATDLAGNTSAVGTTSFTVVAPPGGDTTAPVVTAALSGLPDADGVYLGSATVTLTATDAESAVARVEYALDGAAYARYSAPVTVNRPGEHTLSYRATDAAGNTSGTGSVTFRVAGSGSDPQCPVADTRRDVWFGTVNSKVANRVVERTCTINNLVEDEREWSSQDEFVAHVQFVVDDLRYRRVVTKKEQSRLIMMAGRSGVGMPDTQNGYQAILDGSQKSFARWQQVGEGGFTLNPDGSITSRAEGGMGMLWYPVKAYGNFSLKLRWRDDAPGTGRANSGVFVRFPWVHDHPDESRPEWVAIKYGHELQIYDKVDGDQYKTGSVYGFDRVDLAGAYQTPKGTWNNYEIRVMGQRYSIFRDGRLINEYLNLPGNAFSPPRAGDPGTSGRQHGTGYVGLQNHGAGDVISFRDVRISPLPACEDGTTTCTCC
ncbi:family 16 glycoside hydrolase [Micromonospora sp. NPDC049559]|uniref:OmpL47-type beta-barrel domain-containing protein n=1 Tax=Micromonospora sp. NPDC049559 TaxID=3155923 RepID=UPI0034346657